MVSSPLKMPPSKVIKGRASSNKSLALKSSRFRKRLAASWAKSPPLPLGEPHATRALRLGQEKGRVVFQGALGGGGLAQRSHISIDKIAENLSSLNPHGA